MGIETRELPPPRQSDWFGRVIKPIGLTYMSDADGAMERGVHVCRWGEYVVG